MFPDRETNVKQLKKYKIRRRRRTCADDGDTAREISSKIVCEELCSECAVLLEILSKGIHKGKQTR